MTATPQIANMPAITPNDMTWAQTTTEKPSIWKRIKAFFQRKKKDPVPAPMLAPGAPSGP